MCSTEPLNTSVRTRAGILEKREKEMGNWGADSRVRDPRDYLKHERLQEIVNEFPSGLKQAMFAAASTRTIKRMTWNGCALNAAGIEVGKNNSIRSFATAAKAFGITVAAAGKFVKFWDSMPGTDEECTTILREKLEKAGLFTEPGHHPPRILRKKVYESEQTKLRDEFETLMETNAVPDVDAALELLVGAGV